MSEIDPKDRVLEKLFNETPLTSDSYTTVFEQYKVCIEMADRVSARRQNANNFYLSVTTFLVGFVYAGSGANMIDKFTGITLGLATIAICALWARSIKSYRDLNSGKFAIITEIEKRLPLKPFSTEWEILKRGNEHSNYRPFNYIEKRIPLVFVLISALYILLSLLQLMGYLPDRGSEAVLQKVQWTF